MNLIEIDNSDENDVPYSRVKRLLESHHHYPYSELKHVSIHINVHKNSNHVITMLLTICSNDVIWTATRDLQEFAAFDTVIHKCAFDRRFSNLKEIIYNTGTPLSQLELQVSDYAARLSQLLETETITCNSFLEFLEMDFRGNHFKSIDHKAINSPAIAAAVVTKPYITEKRNHMSLKLGDIISICEMNDSQQDNEVLWKGKITVPSYGRKEAKTLNLEVGYFPSDCVCLIEKKQLEKVFVDIKTEKPTVRRFHARSIVNIIFHELKLRKRSPVFGTDLTEHLTKTSRQYPLVVEQCSKIIEKSGLVTGIYRQCGVQSNIKRLRSKFDNGETPDLEEIGEKDIYSISSLLKQYFRELPTPLFTAQFCKSAWINFQNTADDVSHDFMEELLSSLPPAHYSTARSLLLHLNKLLEYENLTDMTVKSLSIVWAPNLFRSQENNLLDYLTIQTNICSYLISNAKNLFHPDDQLPIEFEKEKIPATHSLPFRNFYDLNQFRRLASIPLYFQKQLGTFRETLNFLKLTNNSMRGVGKLREHSTRNGLDTSATNYVWTYSNQGASSSVVEDESVEKGKERRITFSMNPEKFEIQDSRWTESYIMESESDADSDSDVDSINLEMSRYDNVDTVLGRKSLRRS
ncbi:unnamed protein product [Auanema sp. JU1783]|nr:unnamed protein product [Auanema sp. JU1783]